MGATSAGRPRLLRERDGDEAERGEQRRGTGASSRARESSGMRPKPPASEPAMAPAVFHA